MQRVAGAARVTLIRAGLADLAQRGSAKAMLPRTDGSDPEVVFLNTAGGVTGGDRLDYALSVGAGARATAMTQTAERAYRSGGEAAEMSVRLDVGAGGRLDWLPQETILFEGAHLVRRTEVDLARDATFLGVELVILGRAAHGETLRNARLDDWRRVRRDGRLVHDERLSVTPGALADPAAFGPARAMATLVYLDAGAEDAVGPLRAALGSDGYASGWDGRVVARLVSPAGELLRRALIRAILCLRRDPMPRIWQSDE